jgi:RNA polymerase sigma-70 factor, ECF subfamily
MVELRCFAGLSVEEVAEVVDVSPKTVKRDWTIAKVWLLYEALRVDNGNESRQMGKGKNTIGGRS